MEPTEQDIKHIRKAVIPTRPEAITLLLSSLGILAVFAVITHFQETDESSYQIVASNIETYVRSLLSVLDRLIGVTFLTLMFWMLIGTVVYSMIWMAISTYSTYKNDMPDTKGIIFPRGYKKSNIVHESVAKIAMRTSAIILLLLWTYLLLTKLIPMYISIFAGSSSRILPVTIILSALATVLMAVSIFLVFILSRFILLRSRLFYK